MFEPVEALSGSGKIAATAYSLQHKGGIVNGCGAERRNRTFQAMGLMLEADLVSGSYCHPDSFQSLGIILQEERYYLAQQLGITSNAIQGNCFV